MYWSDEEKVWIPVTRISHAFGVSAQAISRWQTLHAFPVAKRVEFRGETRSLYDLKEVFGWCGTNFTELIRLRRQKKRFLLVQKALSWAIRHPSYDDDDLHVDIE